MNYLYDNLPIIACSTGSNGNSAISVIRLSGENFLPYINKFFSIDIESIKHRYAYVCDLVDNESTLDNVVITFFKGPNSYNGEDILEISVHGNQLNVNRVISLFTDKSSFRLAKEGEFTYRALQNKKLTLSQVEGLDLLLNANSSLMLSQGLDTLQGSLHKSYLKLHNLFLKVKASVEISIDFFEDVGEEIADKNLKESLISFKLHLENLNYRVQGNVESLMSPSVVLVGQTNAGKSSFFNEVLRDGRSIVSSIAGTTRDYISESFCINNTNFRLIDTAGVRDSDDQIEQIGIERTLRLMDEAFYSILVINPFETDIRGFERLYNKSFDLLILTHSDKDGFDNAVSLLGKLPAFSKVIALSLEARGSIGARKADLSGPIGANIINSDGSIGPVVNEKSNEFALESVLNKISLNNGAVSSVNDFMQDVSEKYLDITNKNPILIDRHRSAIKKIYNIFNEFESIISDVDDIAIISSELNIIGHEISELIGIISVDEVLSSIFNNFCIGK